MISAGVVVDDASKINRSTTIPISESPKKKLTGSNDTPKTAPVGAAGSNGSGQSTKRTSSPPPDRLIRTTAGADDPDLAAVLVGQQVRRRGRG